MMISPYGYIQHVKDKSYKELIKERETLLKKIKRLEKELIYGEGTNSGVSILPGPDTQYRMHLWYLAELCTFMREKFREEQNYECEN